MRTNKLEYAPKAGGVYLSMAISVTSLNDSIPCVYFGYPTGYVNVINYYVR